MSDSSLVTYTFWSPNHGGSQNPNFVVIHTIESPLAPGYAKTLCGPAWFGSTKSGTSSTYIIDPVDTCQGVPENTVAWHCGNGNRGSIAIEQSGRAAFNRAQWMTSDGAKQHDRMARLLADINKRRPNIRLQKLTDSELRAAANGGPGGITTHDQCRRVLGGTNHHDPWNQENGSMAYPLDYVLDLARTYRGGGKPPVEDEEEMVYKVFRCNGIDYAWAPGQFFMITSPDHYFFLEYGGLIKQPHGSAPEVAQNYIDFLEAETASRARELKARMGN